MIKFILLGVLLFCSFVFAQEKISAEHLKIRVLAPEVFGKDQETLVGLLFLAIRLQKKHPKQPHHLTHKQ